MPTGNLPSEGKKLWERVKAEALKGSCKGDEECAARIAWTAVKNAGWKKDKEGNWVKGKSLALFSLAIKKASYDEETGEMRWKADTSDTELDLYGDKMSLTLYSDFLERIEKNEVPPEEFVTDKGWNGGMPYMSISHYSDLGGAGIPGPVTDVYVDGKFLKSCGKFNDTPLGKACWKAIKEDQKTGREDKVRISIAFIDYQHKHLSTGYVHEFSNEKPLCPECLKELLSGEYGGLEYQKGLLVHFALTRVPVNQRTNMEVDKSMTTRKEDAASIVGEELAEELEEKSAKVNKSLVIKSEAEEPEVDELQELKAQVDEISKAVFALTEFMSDKKKKEMKDEEEEGMDDEEEDKKEKKMKSDVDLVEITRAFTDTLALGFAGLGEKLDILIAANSQKADTKEYPVRRSVDPGTVKEQLAAPRQDPSKPVSIRDFAIRSVMGNGR